MIKPGKPVFQNRKTDSGVESQWKSSVVAKPSLYTCNSPPMSPNKFVGWLGCLILWSDHLTLTATTSLSQLRRCSSCRRCGCCSGSQGGCCSWGACSCCLRTARLGIKAQTGITTRKSLLGSCWTTLHKFAGGNGKVITNNVSTMLKCTRSEVGGLKKTLSQCVVKSTHHLPTVHGKAYCFRSLPTLPGGHRWACSCLCGFGGATWCHGGGRWSHAST